MPTDAINSANFRFIILISSVTVHISAIHIHKKIVNVKKKTKKNRKNHISHFLKMNRLALKEDWGEWVEGNSMKIVFQLMTHRLHALNIFHVPYSQKNASLVSRSFQCTQKRKEHGKGEKFWVDCGNEMPCGDFSKFIQFLR